LSYQLYKMKFESAHFGEKLLEQSEAIFTTERLFSALFLEAMKFHKEKELLELALSDEFQMSDAMLHNNGLYFPKPIGYPRVNNVQRNNKTESRKEAKKVKELSFLYEDDFDLFLSGEANLEDLQQFTSEQKSLFVNDIKTSVGEDPYRIGTVYYEVNTSLAVIATKHPLIEQLFESLKFSGLGGKRSSGLGQFEFEVESLEPYLLDRITLESKEPVMLLSKALPLDEELGIILDGSSYLLEKSSGFAFSYSAGRNYRKQDLYKFKAGSTFDRTFKGTIVDVAPDNFPHPVWSFSKPLFLRLEVPSE